MNHDISKEYDNKRLTNTGFNYLYEIYRHKLSRFFKRIIGREIIITNNYYLKYKIRNINNKLFNHS